VEERSNGMGVGVCEREGSVTVDRRLVDKVWTKGGSLD
jgi:hypothetical protein